MWNYRCYDDGQSPCLWKRWYANDADKAAQGSHDSVFGILEQQLQWREPYAKLLDKNNGIIEVRLSGRVQWRILGFYGDERCVFVVVAICYHKEKVYTPRDVIKTARRRKAEIQIDLGKALVCERPQ